MRATIVVLVLVVVGLLLLGVGVIAAIGIVITALEAAAVLAAVGIFVIGVGVVIDLFRPAPAACGLVTRAVLRDTCAGACPAGQICTVATTKPYGPQFLPAFLTPAPQAATCACVPPAGAPGGGGTGGGGTGGGGTGGGGAGGDTGGGSGSGPEEEEDN